MTLKEFLPLINRRDITDISVYNSDGKRIDYFIDTFDEDIAEIHDEIENGEGHWEEDDYEAVVDSYLKTLKYQNCHIIRVDIREGEIDLIWEG